MKVFYTYQVFLKGHILTLFKYSAAKNTDKNILLKFDLLLAQTTVNDIGNKQGGGYCESTYTDRGLSKSKKSMPVYRGGESQNFSHLYIHTMWIAPY